MEEIKEKRTMSDNFISIGFSDSKVPDFKKHYSEEYVRFGDDNLYPEYLTYLLNKSPKHGAIVSAKSKYIYGKGLKAEMPDVITDAFIKKYKKLVRKIIYDIEGYGTCYIQVIPTRGGESYNYYHVPYNKIRSDEKNTKFFFRDDWSKRRSEPLKIFPAFSKDLKESSILMYKEYNAGVGVYGLPSFLPCCNAIETDIEVSKHTLTNAQTGFSGSKLINFHDGEPTEADKRSIEKRFKNKYGGSQGDKVILSFNTSKENAPVVLDLGTSDLTKEDFTAIDNMIATAIYAGHQITNPALFGVPNASHALGGNSGAELKLAYEIFKEVYVEDKVEQVETYINYMALLNGIQTEFTLMPKDPVGYTFSEATLLKIAPKSWILEQLGIDSNKYSDAPIEAPSTPKGGSVGEQKQEANNDVKVNDNIKNLTPSQHGQLVRIIRQYGKGQLTKEAATVLLKTGLGLDDADIVQLLGGEKLSAIAQFISMSTDMDEQQVNEAFAQDDNVALLFSVFGESADAYTSFEKRKANFDSEYSDIEEKINALRSLNPKASAADIATALNVDVAIVETYINSEAGAAAIAGKVIKTRSFEVRYSYEKRKDAEGDVLLETSRPFCKKMIALNRLYTREDIQKISAFLGYDVMLRTGGFWNNNGTVEFHCRHEFLSQIVIRKK